MYSNVRILVVLLLLNKSFLTSLFWQMVRNRYIVANIVKKNISTKIKNMVSSCTSMNVYMYLLLLVVFLIVRNVCANGSCSSGCQLCIKNVVKFFFVLQFLKSEFFKRNVYQKALRTGINVLNGGKGNLDQFVTFFVEDCRICNNKGLLANKNDCAKNSNHEQSTGCNESAYEELGLMETEIIPNIEAARAEAIGTEKFDINNDEGNDKGEGSE